MITIKKKQSFFTLTEKWFGYKFNLVDLFTPVAYFALRNVNQRLYFGVRKNTKTVVLDINRPLDKIYTGFSTTLKYDIKKATAENVQCYFSKDRKKFILFYNDFAKAKNLYTLDINRADEYGVDEWKCSYATLNGQILVAHSYLEDGETGIVRLMESGSLRLNGEILPQQIGQANKLLHYHDIQHFCERGLKVYDLGGWEDSNGFELPNLLKFKQAFGAQPVEIFNYFTYAYALKLNIQKIIKSLKKAFLI